MLCAPPRPASGATTNIATKDRVEGQCSRRLATPVSTSQSAPVSSPAGPGAGLELRAPLKASSSEPPNSSSLSASPRGSSSPSRRPVAVTAARDDRLFAVAAAEAAIRPRPECDPVAEVDDHVVSCGAAQPLPLAVPTIVPVNPSQIAVVTVSSRSAGSGQGSPPGRWPGPRSCAPVRRCPALRSDARATTGTRQCSRQTRTPARRLRTRTSACQSCSTPTDRL